MSEEHPTLEGLRVLFTELGYCVAERGVGLAVFVDDGERLVVAGGNVRVPPERLVFIYPSEGSWVVRVARFGGAQWVRPAKTQSDIKKSALEVLSANGPSWEPTPDWTEVMGRI